MNELIDKLNWIYSRYHTIKNLDNRIDGLIMQMEEIAEDRTELAEGLEGELDDAIKDLDKALKKGKTRDIKQVHLLISLINKEEERLKMRQN